MTGGGTFILGLTGHATPRLNGKAPPSSAYSQCLLVYALVILRCAKRNMAAAMMRLLQLCMDDSVVPLPGKP